MQNIAVLGLGIMGGGMASNLIRKGFRVTVWNRSPDRTAPYAAQGAKVAARPREAAAGADMVIAMVADDAASRSVWQGEAGVLAGLKAGAIGVESSTLSPTWIRELAASAKARGADFLDAPVGGSRPAAAEGKLTFFVGGEVAVLAKARPALEAVSVRINHLGGVGAGATWKLINNVMGAAHMAILAEGLALAERTGVDMKLAAELIGLGPTASGMVLGKLSRMTEGRFHEPDFALRLMAKDTRYATDLARAAGAPDHVFQAVADVFSRAEARGLGDLDSAAVHDWIRASAAPPA